MSTKPSYARLSVEDAYHLMLDGPVTVVDIRDEESFKASHMTEARHLDNSQLQSFIDDTDKQVPVVVCCYHGNMSQSAGAYLADKGFAEVYSLDGGFAQWAASYPDDCEPD